MLAASRESPINNGAVAGGKNQARRVHSPTVIRDIASANFDFLIAVIVETPVGFGSDVEYALLDSATARHERSNAFQSIGRETMTLLGCLLI